jgi:hypothetical protein
MVDTLKQLLNDEAGFILSSELVLVSTVGVLGLTAGLAEVSQNVNGELHDVGRAVRSFDQSRLGTPSVTGSAEVDFGHQ